MVFKSYLGSLNKYNPYAIENVKDQKFIHTLRKLEGLSMSKNASNRKERTEIAKEQIQSQIKQSKSINQIYDVYWNSHIRTMISFVEFSEEVKKEYTDARYKITLEWLGEVMYNASANQYQFKPILLKVDTPLTIQPKNRGESWKESLVDVKGRILFTADEEIKVELLTLEEI